MAVVDFVNLDLTEQETLDLYWGRMFRDAVEEQGLHYMFVSNGEQPKDNCGAQGYRLFSCNGTNYLHKFAELLGATRDQFVELTIRISYYKLSVEQWRLAVMTGCVYVMDYQTYTEMLVNSRSVSSDVRKGFRECVLSGTNASEL